MHNPPRKTSSYQDKLASGADRMAKRMGGHFVKNERWQVVVSASESSAIGKDRK